MNHIHYVTNVLIISLL